MRLNVRYADAHKPWLPKPSLVHKVPVVTGPQWRYAPPRTTFVSIDDRRGPQPVSPPATHKVHPWRERRAEVMDTFKGTVLKMATPLNTAAPWRATDEYKDELAWLIDTQQMELPTEADMLRANGIKVAGLQRHDSGEWSISPNLMTGTGEYADAFAALEGLARVEAFLRQTDEQFWFNGPVRRTRLVTDGAKVGVTPVKGPVTPDHLKAVYARMAYGQRPEVVADQMQRFADIRSGTDRRTYHRDDPGVRDLFKRLDALEQERTNDIIVEDHQEVEHDYSPNSACLHPDCAALGEDCPVCYGANTVPHVLGLDSALDFPPPGWGKHA